MTGDKLKFISDAVDIIQRGITGKVISPDKKIQVYQCGTIIRIDIKEV
jgi:hypothetical protein